MSATSATTTGALSGGAAPAPAPADAAGSPGVTATFVRLKLALLRNGLRQSSGRTAAFVTSAVLALLFAAGLVAGLLALRGTQWAAPFAIPLAAVFALGWAVMPLFFPGGDETLDPSRLVMLPLRPRRIVTGLLAASVVGIGPVITLAFAVGAVLSLAHGPAAWVLAVLGVPLILLTCVALARLVAATNVRLLSSRRGRDLALVSGLLIAVGMQFVNLGVQRLTAAGGPEALEPFADVLRWVPPASAVGAVLSASDGVYGAAAVQFLLAVAAPLLLLWWWRGTLTRLMTSPDSSTLQAATTSAKKTERGRAAVRRGGQGDAVPSRSGATARRVLRYLWRDPKTKVGWGTALCIGLLLPAMSVVQGYGTVWTALWAPAMVGMMTYNQLGQDYSGFWMVAATVSTARDARRDLAGRTLAAALLSVPAVTLTVLVTAGLLGRWDDVPHVLGLSWALLGAFLSTGALVSVRLPYSVPQGSGYKNVVPGQGSLAYLSLLGGLVCAAVLGAPAIALTVWAHLAGGPVWLWLLPLVGAVYGAALTVLALRVAGRTMAGRLPEILTAVSKG